MYKAGVMMLLVVMEFPGTTATFNHMYNPSDDSYLWPEVVLNGHTLGEADQFPSSMDKGQGKTPGTWRLYSHSERQLNPIPLERCRTGPLRTQRTYARGTVFAADNTRKEWSP